MPKRYRGPRNEASRRDMIAQREIITGALKNILARNDSIAAAPFTDPEATVAITGTAVSAGGSLESEIVTGGRTVILTLTGAVWHADIAADNTRTADLVAGFVAAESEAAGWTAQILAGDGSMDYTDVVRTSDTVVTVTLPASASYSVSTHENITIQIPGSALADGAYGKGFTINTVPLKITAGSFALTGTAVAGGVLESEIVTGGETVILTLTADAWVATMASDNAITTAFIAAFTGDASGAGSWNDENALAHGNIVRTSDTVVTVTLPAVGAYSISSNETLTFVLPEETLASGVTPGNQGFTVTEGS